MSESLSFPEDDTDLSGRKKFEDGLMELLDGAAFIVFQPLPAPTVPRQIMSISEIQIIETENGGVAWCVPAKSLREVIELTFALRIPEVVVMGFMYRPTPEAIARARISSDGAPARMILFFDEGDLR